MMRKTFVKPSKTGGLTVLFIGLDIKNSIDNQSSSIRLSHYYGAIPALRPPEPLLPHISPVHIQ